MNEAPAPDQIDGGEIVRQIAELLESEGWDVTDTSLIPMDVRMAAVRKVMA